MIRFNLVTCLATREADRDGKPHYSLRITQPKNVDIIEVTAYSTLMLDWSRAELKLCFDAAVRKHTSGLTGPTHFYLSPIGKAVRGWSTMTQPSLTLDPTLA